MANGRTSTLLDLWEYNELSKPDYIPKDKDIEEANKLFKDMFGYNVETGAFTDVLSGKEVVSPAESLQRQLDMNANILDLKRGDEPLRKLEKPYSLFTKPMFDWDAIGLGATKLRSRAQRKQLFSEVEPSPIDATGVSGVSIKNLPEPEPFAMSYSGVDVETPEGKRTLLNKANLETFLNNQKREDWEMRTMQEKQLEAYNKKVKNIRPIPWVNPLTNEESTVLMQSIEVDGKYYATPTLFPNDPNEKTPNPMNWKQLSGRDAFLEAEKRGELFEFLTAEEADDFARGSWKSETQKEDISFQNWLSEQAQSILPRNLKSPEEQPSQDQGNLPLKAKSLRDWTNPRFGIKRMFSKMKGQD